MSILKSLEIIYLDFLSGRVPVPLELKTLEDEMGFSSEVINLSKDIRLIFDDGSYLDFPAGTNINDVSSRAELTNDSITMSVEDIKIFDSTQTLKTTSAKLIGDGFYEGFQEWWFVTRVINGETIQFLRFNLEVELDEGVIKIFKPGTKWTDCIYEIESISFEGMSNYTKPDFQTEVCVRKCCSPMVPLVNPDDIPEDLLGDIKSIMDSND